MARELRLAFAMGGGVSLGNVLRSGAVGSHQTGGAIRCRLGPIRPHRGRRVQRRECRRHGVGVDAARDWCIGAAMPKAWRKHGYTSNAARPSPTVPSRCDGI